MNSWAWTADTAAVVASRQRSAFSSLIPLFVHLYKLPEKKARATTVFCILPMVVITALFYGSRNYIDFKVGLLCAIGGIIGSFIGSKLLNILNPKYLKIIERKYSFDKNTNVIVLQSVNKQTKHLQDVIKENKGKVIYIDLWASWCLPCRVAMPYSNKLREKYNEKDIVFVYLSIDKDFDKWKSANTKESLEFYKNSYLIVNQESSAEYKKLGIQTIPRYLLYDKNGKLILLNAPGPDAESIEKTLENILNN